MRKGARKGALNITCFNSAWPVSRDRRVSHFAIDDREREQAPKHMQLTIGSWNVRTLMENTNTDRPERRTALVARELSRYNIDMAALSETRRAGEGQLTEPTGGSFFCSGRNEEDRRVAGVGIAIKKRLGINERLVTLQVPLKYGRSLTLISVYAPTMTNSNDIKDKFYEDLDATISSVPKPNKLLVLGDFNARVGHDHTTCLNIIGHHGIGSCNSNSVLLLKTCGTRKLLKNNRVYPLPLRNKTTWMHPRSKQWYLIDYIVTRQCDRQDIRVTKSKCGAECWTDHRLIVSKLNMSIKPTRRL
ncbi:craniofacial development protein 2-like [Montipora foliosa]|uniref:craniofacial development protein 2-like n=1 Tax=Montipora foliosa TaxID=591990 RepID=UPI0035F15DDF